MGVNKFKFLEEPEPDKFKFLESGVIQGGDGGGDTPGTAILPAEAPPSAFERFASRIDKFFVGRGAIPVGKPHPAVAEAYSKAKLPVPSQMFSTEDAEKMEFLFQEQQKFGMVLLEGADILDRPRRVMTNILFQFGSGVERGVRKTFFLPGLQKPRFETMEDAMKKGWSNEDTASLLQATEANIIGETGSEFLDAVSQRHWALKYSRKFTAFLSNLAADAVIDYGIFKGIIFPIRKGIIKYGTPRMADAIRRMSKEGLDQGFERAVTRAANEAADLKTTARLSLDDMIRQSVDGSPGIPPVPTTMLATADDVAGVTESLVRKTNRGRRLKASLGVTEDQIIDLQIKKQNGLLQEADAIFSTDFDADFLESKRVLLADQLIESAKDVEATKLLLKEMREKSVTIDYKASSRNLREAYIKAHIAFIDDADKIASIDHFIKLASGNTTDAIEDLTEEQFDTLLAFIDAKAKDPSNWNYLSADAPGTKGIIRRSGRRLFMNQVVSPAWQVFDRLGGGRIYQFVDDATFNRYTHVQRAMGTWEQHLDNIGINPRKKVRSKADADSLRKVFLLADGRATDFSGEITEDVIANIKTFEPTIAPGFVRLYRATTKTPKPLPAWISTEHLGRWYSDTPENLLFYFDELDDPVLNFIDVPIDEASRHSVLNLPKAKKFSADPNTEYFVSPELAKKAKQLPLGNNVTFDVSKGRVDFPVAKESWITTVTPEERAAAEYVNKEARVLSDMAVAQGRLSHTGEGAPRVIEHYITHLFDRSATQSKIDMDALLELTKAMPEGEAKDEFIRVARSKAQAELTNIADIHQFKFAEDVNIDQFLRRIGSREGLIEDADPAFRTMLRSETNALYMQPAYQQARAMAEATENKNLIDYTRLWVNNLRGVPTTGKFLGIPIGEADLEPMMQDFSQLLERGTAWLPEFTHLQWKAEDRAVRQVSKWFRSKTYFAAMGFNPGPVVTNTTQSMLTIGAIGTRSTAAGFRSLSTQGGRQALKHSRLLVGRNPLHSMSLDQMSRLGRAGGWTFRQVDHWMNVAPAFNGSLHKQLFDNPKKIAILRKYGPTEGGSFWNTLSKALDADEFIPETDIANRVAKLTQYSYLRHDSPQGLANPLGSMFGQFLSWPANYWNSYIPEMAKWMWTGNSPFGPLSTTERATLLRHVLLAEVMIAGAKANGIDLRKVRPVQPGMLGPLPFLFPGGAAPQKTPALRILSGAAQVFTSQGDERKKNEGLREIQAGFMIKAGMMTLGNEFPHFIPFFPQGLRRLGKAGEAEDFRPLFFRMSEEEKQSTEGTPSEPGTKSKPTVPGL